MDSRGSSILGRASSSEDSTSHQEDYDRSQSYQNHFFDAIRKNPEMCTTIHTPHTPPNSLDGDIKTAQNTTNIYFRTPTSSCVSQEFKEDNEDNTSVKPTDYYFDSNTNTQTISPSNPFTFKCDVEVDQKANEDKTTKNSDASGGKMSPDNNLATINNINNLLKQLQALNDRENELMKEGKGIVTSDNKSPTDNAYDQTTAIFENRKKSRPQILLRKVIGILSTSNSDLKNEISDSLSAQKTSKSQTDEKEYTKAVNSDIHSLRALRLEKLEMTTKTLGVVDSLRDDISGCMPGVVRRRAQKCSSVSPSPSINGLASDSELPLLLGRCFNLSVNLKILRQCNFQDPGIGCRVFVDFDVLENYLRREIKDCKASLGTEQGNTEKSVLCPMQLEANINALSI